MLIGLGLLFGVIFGYQFFKSIMTKKYMAGMSNPPVTVSAEKIKESDWQTTVQASGSLRAINGVDVTTELAGMVRTISFKPGAYVKKDVLLVKLNDDVEIAQLNSLYAQLEIAKTTYDRDKAQFAVHAVSQQTLDNDAANVKSLKAQVDQQKATIDKKLIRSPFEGKLGISAVNLGQYLQPGNKIVTLQSLDPIYVDFFIPQQFIPQLKIGQVMTLTTDTFPNENFEGKITTIDPIVDASSRNVRVEATITNPKHKLLPGMFGTVEIITGKPRSLLTLPQTAISFNPYGEVAFILQEKGKDDKGNPILIANQTFVTVGEKRGDQVSIVKGLKEGDFVVVSGGHKLKNGSIVHINNKVLPADNPNPDTPNE